MSIEVDYAVYRWDDEQMTFVRRLFIRVEVGEAVTNEMVRSAFADDLGNFPRGLYRAVPGDRCVDLEVKAEVVLS